MFLGHFFTISSPANSYITPICIVSFNHSPSGFPKPPHIEGPSQYILDIKITEIVPLPNQQTHHKPII